MNAILDIAKDYEKKKDLVKAENAYTQALEAGDLRALNPLGEFYLKYAKALEERSGLDENVSFERAFDLFEASAERNSDFGNYKLGNCYKKGIGTKADLDEAIYYYMKAADQNYVKAALALVEIYQEEHDRYMELYWMEKAAHAGDASSAYILAELALQEGRSTQEIIDWLTMAAENGNAKMRFKVANTMMDLYYFNQNSFKKDETLSETLLKEASCWYEKASSSTDTRVSLQAAVNLNRIRSCYDS